MPSLWKASSLNADGQKSTSGRLPTFQRQTSTFTDQQRENDGLFHTSPLVDVYPNANRKERGHSDITWEDLHPFTPTGRNTRDNTQFPWINLPRQSLEVRKRRDLGSTHLLHHWHPGRKRRESSDTPTETDTLGGGSTATPPGTPPSPIRRDSQELSEVVGVNADGDVVVTVAGLVPYSVYMLRVRLVNVLGQGPVSGNSVRVFTLPDGQCTAYCWLCIA